MTAWLTLVLAGVDFAWALLLAWGLGRLQRRVGELGDELDHRSERR